jgi:hypothetical protein
MPDAVGEALADLSLGLGETAAVAGGTGLTTGEETAEGVSSMIASGAD